MQQQGMTSRRVELLLLGVLLVYSSHALPVWIVYVLQSTDDSIAQWLGPENWYEL